MLPPAIGVIHAASWIFQGPTRSSGGYREVQFLLFFSLFIFDLLVDSLVTFVD